MARKDWGWVFVEPKAKVAQEAQKIIIQKEFDVVIEDFKKRFIQKPSTEWGYTSDVYGKWYRHYFYICQTMTYDNPGYTIKQAEYKVARIECFDNQTYGISYMRHTEQWFEIANGLSLSNCLEMLSSNPIFFP